MRGCPAQQPLPAQSDPSVLAANAENYRQNGNERHGSCAVPGVFPFYSAKEKGTVMDLKDFIQTAVSQIVEGMVAAQAAAATHGATLNPAVEPAGKGNPSAAAQTAAGTRVSNIAFDVAVTAVEGSDADGTAKLRVAGSGADLQAKGEHVTRLQFSLPIALPQARARRPMATALDSEFLQTVENDDSTWLPAR